MEQTEQLQKDESKIKLTPKEYYQKNKLAILRKGSEQHQCEICNGKYTTANKSKHVLTKKHIFCVAMKKSLEDNRRLLNEPVDANNEPIQVVPPINNN